MYIPYIYIHKYLYLYTHTHTIFFRFLWDSIRMKLHNTEYLQWSTSSLPSNLTPSEGATPPWQTAYAWTMLDVWFSRASDTLVVLHLPTTKNCEFGITEAIFTEIFFEMVPPTWANFKRRVGTRCILSSWPRWDWPPCLWILPVVEIHQNCTGKRGCGCWFWRTMVYGVFSQ